MQEDSMAVDETHTRTLRRALELAGSEAALAEALHTSPEVLSRWLSGELQAPHRVYFAALAIITTRRLATKPK
jgi:DNA-binding transcriptional regulator YdaS (Cro superfamily)